MWNLRHVMSFFGMLQAVAVLTIIASIVTGLNIPLRYLELFSHFRLQYFVVSALLLLVFSALRHYAYAAALATIVIFNASFVLPWYFSRSTAAEGNPLKLIHVNVRSRNTEYDRMVAFVAAEKPDMVFMQEVTAEWLAGTKALLADYPYFYVESRSDSFGIAAFSKIPFDAIRHIDSPPLGHPTIIASVTINGEEVTLLSSHPSIPVGRHLYEARNEHLRSLTDLVIQARGKIIMLGDFNASLWCAHFRQLETSTGLKNVRRGFGILPSWPTYLPFAMIPIDHALVSESISVSDVRTGVSIGSDHLPLVVTLSM